MTTEEKRVEKLVKGAAKNLMSLVSKCYKNPPDECLTVEIILSKSGSNLLMTSAKELRVLGAARRN